MTQVSKQSLQVGTSQMKPTCFAAFAAALALFFSICLLFFRISCTFLAMKPLAPSPSLRPSLSVLQTEVNSVDILSLAHGEGGKPKEEIEPP